MLPGEGARALRGSIGRAHTSSFLAGTARGSRGCDGLGSTVSHLMIRFGKYTVLIVGALDSSMQPRLSALSDILPPSSPSTLTLVQSGSYDISTIHQIVTFCVSFITRHHLPPVTRP